jgi:hypothetical protein
VFFSSSKIHGFDLEGLKIDANLRGLGFIRLALSVLKAGCWLGGTSHGRRLRTPRTRNMQPCGSPVNFLQRSAALSELDPDGSNL